MTRTLTPYPAYKDTGIEWLGQIPAHWEVHTFRQIARAVKGSQPQKLYLEHEAPPEAKPYLTMEYLRAPQGNAKFYCVPVDGDVVANAGDILLLWDGANAGEFFVAKEGVVSSTAALLQVAHRHTRYLYFVLKQCEPLLRAFSTGMGIPHVDGRTLRQMPIPLPPLAEQAAIVRFLDFVDGRIRRYTHAQQRVIDRLTEYKQAVIHQAVTGKIDVRTGAPYPAYTDTGIEWLGQVPKHWELKPLKHWVRMNARTLPETTPADYEFRYIDIGTVGTGYLLKEPQVMRFGEAPSRARRVVQAGDTIISTVRTYLKAVYYVDGDPDALVCSTGFAVLTPRQGTHPKFVSYLVQSDSFANCVSAESVGTAYPAITEGQLGRFYVAIPPLAEQAAIVQYLDEQTARLDAAIAAVQRRLALVGEYRERLIADVVTGKLDVRAVAAELPHDTDAPTDTETYGEAYHVGDAVP
jgi:type I restriction enzyme S subunit